MQKQRSAAQRRAAAIHPRTARSPSSRLRRARRLFLLAAALAAAPRAWGIDRIITTSTNWGNGLAWTPSGVPGQGDNAYVVSGGSDITVTFDTNYNTSLGVLTLDGSSIPTLSHTTNVQLYAAVEYVGKDGLGVYTQSAGTNLGTSLYVGVAVGSGGTYTLSGSGTLTFAQSETIGYQGTGNFVQSGGVNTVNGGVSQGLYLGYAAGSHGAYSLANGGILTVAAGEFIGDFGAGTFDQSGGAHTINSVVLILGNNSGASGTYTLSNGTLAVINSDEYVGSSGAGTFNQSGGTHTLDSRGLYLGLNTGGSGTYNLSGSGKLSVVSEFIAFDGSGVFNQSGGTHTVSNQLFIGDHSGVTGTYNLTGGNLSAADISLYTGGTFHQGGGSLQFGGFTQFAGSAIFDPAVNLFVDQAHYNLQNGTLAVGGSEYVGYTAGGVVNQNAGTHSVSGYLSLGYNVGSSGTYGLGGGNLSAAHEIIGAFGSGSFIQTGGTHSVSVELHLGDSTMGSGSYDLSGGNLTTADEYIGFSGTGVFNHGAGTHTVSGANGLYLGYNVSGSGTYTLSGGTSTVLGTLNVAGEWIGYGGTGNFIQTGGCHTVSGTNGLYLGYAAGGSGSFTLSGGTLALTNGAEMFVGFFGTGTFNHSGGTHTINFENFALGAYSGASGTYNLSNGTLSFTGSFEYVGLSGNGMFNQSGGTHTIDSGGLYVGYSSGGSGTYMLSNGTLALTSSSEYVGYSGRGALIQSGGVHTIGGTLFIGFNAGSTGAVNLSGGQLTAAALVNNGTFTQTGGNATFGDVSGPGSISIGAGAATALASVARLGPWPLLSVNNNGTLIIRAAPNRLTNYALSLGMSGNGTLDLYNHELLTFTSPASIKSFLANAYGPGADWAGPGLTSSVARGNPITYSVAYAFGNDPSAIDPPVETNGAPIPGGAVIVRAVLTGDANMDGKVNFFDLAQILGYRYNAGGNNAPYTDGDLNYDGKVDFFDIVTLPSANYNSGQNYLGSSGIEPASPTATPTLSGVDAQKPGVPSSAMQDSSGLAGEPALVRGALLNSPGFTDPFDIGLALAPGLQLSNLGADLTLVPEPTGLCLLTLGAAGLTVARRRQRSEIRRH